MAESQALADAGVDAVAAKLKMETELGRIDQRSVHSVSRFLHSVARRAKLRREEKSRATAVGMT